MGFRIAAEPHSPFQTKPLVTRIMTWNEAPLDSNERDSAQIGTGNYYDLVSTRASVYLNTYRVATEGTAMFWHVAWSNSEISAT